MPRRPLTIVLAAALEGALGAAVVILGALLLVTTLMGRAEGDTASALAATAFAAGVGALLCYLAWGLFRLHDWARTPVVLTQLFALPIAWYLVRSEQYVAGGVLAAAAVATLVLMFTPSTTAALFPEESGRKS